MEQHYAEGTVRSLLLTEYVTAKTRQVLDNRMVKSEETHLFFDAPVYEVLSIACDRLVAQNSRDRIVDIAYFIDQRLAHHTGDGWRYNNMPSDEKMYLNGLKGIDETSILLFKATFIRLTISQQSAVLQSLQKGVSEGLIWKEMQSKLFFEELLTEVAEIFYSSPLVQEEIGYVGMADAKGWTRIGLNERDDIEPVALPNKEHT